MTSSKNSQAMIWEDSTTTKEERFNTITQIIGVAFGVIALIFLLQPSVTHSDQLRFLGNLIYGITLILMFLSSGLFHGFFFSKAKKVLYILDNAAIFVFIAGTFTPLNLDLLHGWVQIISLAFVWMFAVFGVLYSIFNIYKSKVPVIMYLAFGWVGLLIMYPLLIHTSLTILLLFIAGGLLYSLGTIYLKSSQMLYHHGVWHLFVMAASVLHFFTILNLR
jgi:hemolysin III